MQKKKWCGLSTSPYGALQRCALNHKAQLKKCLPRVSVQWRTEAKLDPVRSWVRPRLTSQFRLYSIRQPVVLSAPTPRAAQSRVIWATASHGKNTATFFIAPRYFWLHLDIFDCKVLSSSHTAFCCSETCWALPLLWLRGLGCSCESEGGELLGILQASGLCQSSCFL